MAIPSNALNRPRSLSPEREAALFPGTGAAGRPVDPPHVDVPGASRWDRWKDVLTTPLYYAGLATCVAGVLNPPVVAPIGLGLVGYALGSQGVRRLRGERSEPREFLNVHETSLGGVAGYVGTSALFGALAGRFPIATVAVVAGLVAGSVVTSRLGQAMQTDGQRDV